MPMIRYSQTQIATGKCRKTQAFFEKIAMRLRRVPSLSASLADVERAVCGARPPRRSQPALSSDAAGRGAASRGRQPARRRRARNLSRLRNSHKIHGNIGLVRRGRRRMRHTRAVAMPVCGPRSAAPVPLFAFRDSESHSMAVRKKGNACGPWDCRHLRSTSGRACGAGAALLALSVV